ncbi:hypothetical protein BST97_01310 [Nonlabens spongiae]|uniref:Thioesterase domain-containing protein n=1 Tax=Nonlabens spongiae TaxID=331648 RepID=A0A1W6MGZ2_9FLAO|nr:hypothetical protein [Nonlabens spongiae]ARN76749.1 hypothetical protein BST97_01310 [Nonlabens spongiae]
MVEDIRRSRWHGGLIDLLMDSVGGMVRTANLISKEYKFGTIDLRIDYLQGAKAFDQLKIIEYFWTID